MLYYISGCIYLYLINGCILDDNNLNTIWKGLEKTEYSYIERLVTRIDRPMFEWTPGETGEKVERICVFVFLPRYLVETWHELCESVQQNKSAIDHMVQVKIEKELLIQKLDVSFLSFAQSKCTLRPDHILEYLFDLRSAP